MTNICVVHISLQTCIVVVVVLAGVLCVCGDSECVVMVVKCQCMVDGGLMNREHSLSD